MLETIRELALERFADLHDVEIIRRRHAMYYRALALTASLDTDVPGEQQPEIVFPEVPNLRAALAWAFERGEIEYGLALLVALEQFWVSGYTEEGMRWYRAFLERADDVPPLLRAPALRSFGSSAHFAGDFELAERLWEEGLAIYEAEQSEHGIAVLLHRLSISALEHRDISLARDRAERSLALHRRLATDKGACQPLSVLGALALQAGDVERGTALLEESSALAKKIGWRWWRAGTQSLLADVALARGRTDEAEELIRESIGLALELADRVGLSWYLAQFALVSALEGKTSEAGTAWGAVEAARAFIPGGPWPRDFPALEQRVLALADSAFEEARNEGAGRTLEDVASGIG